MNEIEYDYCRQIFYKNTWEKSYNLKLKSVTLIMRENDLKNYLWNWVVDRPDTQSFDLLSRNIMDMIWTPDLSPKVCMS